MESPALTVQIDRLYQWIEDVRTQFTREIDQALLKRDLYLGMEALGGRDACDRLRRQIEARFRMDESWSSVDLPVRPPQRAPLPSWYRPKKGCRKTG